MSLTVPQLVLMNHAAWVNRERGQRRFDAKREREKLEEGQEPAPSITVEEPASDLANMNSDQWASYYNDFMN